MRQRMLGLLYFTLTIAAVILVLKTLSWVPLVLQKETLRPFDSLEQARSKLNIKGLLVPSYFPQTVTWPPSKVLAQAEPYPAVLMVFQQAGKREDGLIVSQAASDAFPGTVSIRFAAIREKVDYDLRGRKALLEVGFCTDTQPCSRLTWKEGESRVMIIMKSTPFELIRIAQSMLH